MTTTTLASSRLTTSTSTITTTTTRSTTLATTTKMTATTHLGNDDAKEVTTTKYDSKSRQDQERATNDSPTSGEDLGEVDAWGVTISVKPRHTDLPPVEAKPDEVEGWGGGKADPKFKQRI